MKQSIWKSFFAIVLFLTVFLAAPTMKAQADATATAITIGKTDYDELTMEVNINQNSIVYISSDKKNWYEVEGEKSSDHKYYLMDISWIPSNADKTIYFKGDKVATVVPVTIPGKDTSLKVTYNKADEDFTFTNCDSAEYFQWRKSTDYHWYQVPMNSNTPEYKSFMKTVESFLCKGAKIVFRIPQKLGTDTLNTGERPSKEVTVTLAKRANAPSVSVNASKLTLNTTTKMEYFDTSKNKWVDCEKGMSVEEIAPKALYENGGHTVTVEIRVAATSSKSYSKSAFVTIPGQAKAPEVNKSNEISYYTEENSKNKKFCLQFLNASKQTPYSYCIVKPGAEYDVSKVTWKQVTDSKVKKLSSTTVPEGSTIYVRKQGRNANVSKNIALMLSSKEEKFIVNYNSKPEIVK